MRDFTQKDDMIIFWFFKIRFEKKDSKAVHVIFHLCLNNEHITVSKPFPHCSWTVCMFCFVLFCCFLRYGLTNLNLLCSLFCPQIHLLPHWNTFKICHSLFHCFPSHSWVKSCWSCTVRPLSGLLLWLFSMFLLKPTLRSKTFRLVINHPLDSRPLHFQFPVLGIVFPW